VATARPKVARGGPATHAHRRRRRRWQIGDHGDGFGRRARPQGVEDGGKATNGACGSEEVRSSENVVARASTVAMVFTLTPAPSIARERAKGVRGDGEGARALHLRGGRALGHTAAAQCHGGGAATAWRTRWQFIKHLAGIHVASVEDKFGPLPSRIWIWGKNEVCQARPTLQLWLRCHDH